MKQHLKSHTSVTLFLRFQIEAWGYFRGLPSSYGLGFGASFPLFAEGRSGRGFRESLVDFLGVKGLPGVVDGSLFLSANLGNAVSMACKEDIAWSQTQTDSVLF